MSGDKAERHEWKQALANLREEIVARIEEDDRRDAALLEFRIENLEKREDVVVSRLSELEEKNSELTDSLHNLDRQVAIWRRA